MHHRKCFIPLLVPVLPKKVPVVRMVKSELIWVNEIKLCGLPSAWICRLVMLQKETNSVIHFHRVLQFWVIMQPTKNRRFPSYEILINEISE
jgi:hypothetical protein